MSVGLRGHLGQVGHAQHLTALGQTPEMAADQFRHPAAHPGVDLVEHHHRQPPAGRDQDTKAYPRLLSPGGRAGERSRRMPGIDADPELDVVDAGRAGLPGRAHRDREFARPDPELAYAPGHLVRQAPGGGLPARAQALGGFPIEDPCRGVRFFELAYPRLARLQTFPLCLEGGEPLRQLVRGYPVFARGVVKGGEPVLDPGEPLRIGFDVPREGAHRRTRLGDVDECRFEELAGGAGGAGGLALDLGEPGQGEACGGIGGVLLAEEQVVDRVRRVSDLDRVGETPALRGQLRRFPGLHGERGQLVALEAQVVDPALPFRAAGRPGVAQRRFERGRAAMQLPDPREEVGVSGGRIEHPALVSGAQQRMVGVLALQIHQPGAELAQGLRRHRAIVDPCPGAAVPGDPAAQGALVPIRFDAERIAELFEPGQPVRGEGGGGLRPLGAGTDHFGARASAERQPERIDQDRLSGPGLSGEHGEAGPDLDVEPVDDREVADCEMGKQRCRGWRNGARG